METLVRVASFYFECSVVSASAGARPPCPTHGPGPGAPEPGLGTGPVGFFAVQPGSGAPFVGLECAVRASSSAGPRPNPPRGPPRAR